VILSETNKHKTTAYFDNVHIDKHSKLISIACMHLCSVSAWIIKGCAIAWHTFKSRKS